MEIERVYYPDRAEMVRGVCSMAAEGWVAQAIANLAEQPYRVEFARPGNRAAPDRDPGTHAGHDGSLRSADRPGRIRGGTS